MNSIVYPLKTNLLAESLLKEPTISFSSEGVHLLPPLLHFLVDLLMSFPPLTRCALLWNYIDQWNEDRVGDSLCFWNWDKCQIFCNFLIKYSWDHKFSLIILEVLSWIWTGSLWLCGDHDDTCNTTNQLHLTASVRARKAYLELEYWTYISGWNKSLITFYFSVGST